VQPPRAWRRRQYRAGKLCAGAYGYVFSPDRNRLPARRWCSSSYPKAIRQPSIPIAIPIPTSDRVPRSAAICSRGLRQRFSWKHLSPRPQCFRKSYSLISRSVAQSKRDVVPLSGRLVWETSINEEKCMRHVKTVTRASRPALAACSTLQGCVSDLLNTGDLAAFKTCVGEKCPKGN
jgi:hypothetical protein